MYDKDMALNAYIANQRNRLILVGEGTNSPLLEKAKRQKEKTKALMDTINSVKNFTGFDGATKHSNGNVMHSQKVPSERSSSSPNAWLNHAVEDTERKKKKKAKKKAKKREEACELIRDQLGMNYLEVDYRTPNLLSELIKNNDLLLNVDGNIYVYDSELGCYSQTNQSELSTKLYSLLDEDIRLKVKSLDFKEAYSLLCLSDPITDDGTVFFSNGPYVNCLSGIVDVTSKRLLKHDAKYRFKYCIRANYVPGSSCPLFMEFVHRICGNDEDLEKLLQAVLGYLCSFYNNAKKAVLLYAMPHTGKSVLCKVIENIIGPNISHVELKDMHKQEYAASLANAILNIASDLSNAPLKEVGTFKALLSHTDTISARALYSNPINIRAETKFLFSTNHFVEFDCKCVSTYDIMAVFQRLLYIPFQNPSIQDCEDNKHLVEDLMVERDAIFTWCMDGLKLYVDGNETFPVSALSEEVKAKNMAKYCPEKVFYETYIKKADDRFESSSLIRQVFDAFCHENGVKSKPNIGDFLQNHQGIKKSKRRIDDKGNLVSEGNPVHVYEGIRIRKKFRNLVQDEEIDFSDEYLREFVW